MSTNPARLAFDLVEQVVAKPLDKAVNAPQASYVLMSVGKASLFGLRRVEDARSGLAHLWSLPSRRDVARLSSQVARLQNSIDEVEQQIEDLRAERRA